jgi:hypothetical protein
LAEDDLRQVGKLAFEVRIANLELGQPGLHPLEVSALPENAPAGCAAMPAVLGRVPMNAVRGGSRGPLRAGKRPIYHRRAAMLAFRWPGGMFERAIRALR